MPRIIIGKKEISCKLILFDLDGTLLDERTRNKNLAWARIKTISKYAGSEAAKIWATLSGVNTATGTVDINGPIPRAPRGEDMAVATTAIYQTGRRWHVARNLAQKAYKDADRMLISNSNPSLFPGISKSLSALKNAGLLLGIATNGSGVASRDLMEGAGMTSLFDVFIGADDVVNAKPAADMLLLACERTGVETSEAVYVGNELDDVLAARAALIGTVIAINNSDEEMNELADIVVNSVTEIRVV